MLGKHALFAQIIFLGWSLIGCQEDLVLRNAIPAVTTIGPVVVEGEDTAFVYLTIQDLERDPVDVLIQVVDETGTVLPFEGNVTSGHGVVGLSSDKSFPGTAHEIAWDTSSLESGEYTLQITPDDRLGGVGNTVESPPFALGEGLQEVTIP